MQEEGIKSMQEDGCKQKVKKYARRWTKKDVSGRNKWRGSNQTVCTREELQRGMREVRSNEGFLFHETGGKLTC